MIKKEDIPFYLFFFIPLFFSCNNGNKNENNPPDTSIIVDEINLTGDNRLKSEVTLNWFGTDKDGYVTAYEFSFDKKNWKKTRKTDSTFLFTITSGSNTQDVDFWVRSIDNDQDKDPNPDHLKIPIKNTPPDANFISDQMPFDTVNSAVTLSWKLSDVDGQDNLKTAFIKVNNGSWYEVDINESVLTLTPESPSVAGTQKANVYYETNAPEAEKMEGLNVGDTNIFYIKAEDRANSESKVDTSKSIYIKKKSGDLLLVGADKNSNVDSYYKNTLDNVYSNNYDFVDFEKNNGERQPKFWNQNFFLQISLYDKLVFYSGQNTTTGEGELIIEAAVSSLQRYFDNNGKALITTSFPGSFNNNSNVFQRLPMDSISSSEGQARLHSDSTLYAQFPGEHPDLDASDFVLDLKPFYPTADADVIYKTPPIKKNGWTGPENMAARRKKNGNTVQVFFSMKLYKLQGNGTANDNFFDRILNNEFNW
ncbi:MAG: hypothetical protein ABEH43_07165 [Flavobacteriales bacterium]